MRAELTELRRERQTVRAAIRETWRRLCGRSRNAAMPAGRAALPLLALGGSAGLIWLLFRRRARHDTAGATASHCPARPRESMITKFLHTIGGLLGSALLTRLVAGPLQPPAPADEPARASG